MPVPSLAIFWMILKIICCVCYPEYSSTIDGMPAIAKAEAIVLRLLTKDLKIIDLLVRLKLFLKKVTIEELANHIV